MREMGVIPSFFTYYTIIGNKKQTFVHEYAAGLYISVHISPHGADSVRVLSRHKKSGAAGEIVVK
jgi:hypothetical protein